MLQLSIGGRWRKQKMSHLPQKGNTSAGYKQHIFVGCLIRTPPKAYTAPIARLADEIERWAHPHFFPQEIKDLWMKFKGKCKVNRPNMYCACACVCSFSRHLKMIMIYHSIMWYHVRQVFRSTFSGALKPHLWHLAERDTHVETVGWRHTVRMFFCTPMLHLPLPTFWSSGLWKHKFLMSPLWVTSATLQICLAPAVSQILSDSCMFAWYPFLLSCYFPWLPLCCAWWQWQWPLCVTKMMSRSVRIIFRLGESCTAVTDQCSV